MEAGKSQMIARRWGVVGATACLLLLAGCGRDEPVGSRDVSADNAVDDHEYALRLYVGLPGEERLLLVPPGDRYAARGDGDTDGPGLSTKAIGVGAIDIGDLEESSATEFLARSALDSCIAEHTEFEDGAAVAGATFAVAPIYDPYPAWTNKWWLFKTAELRATCDTLLVAQELTLCAADKVASIADSAGTQKWTTRSGELSLTIPPQATADKFIARDAALNTLGHLARLQKLQPTSYNGDCPGAYARLGYSSSDNVIGTAASPAREYLPGGAAPGDGEDYEDYVARLGRLRLMQTAHISRAAARLVRDLVTENVRDDLAGAERRRSEAGDPVRGARAMWGFRGEEELAEYNSLGHALRTLYGRLEIGPNPGAPGPTDEAWSLNDPMCDGVQARGLLHQMPSGHEARWRDRPPSTPEQALAVSTLTTAGIIVPPGNLGEAVLVQAVVKQLARNAGVEEDELGGDSSGWPARAQAVERIFSRLSDADIRFAIERNLDAWDLITYGRDVTIAQAESAGMVVLEQGETVDELEGVSGFVIAGGIPRDQLPTDMAAEMGPVQTTSNCGASKDSLDYLFQNPFLLGWHFRDNVGSIQEELALVSDPDGELGELVELSLAEIGEWTGDVLEFGPQNNGYRSVSIRGAGVAERFGIAPTASNEDAGDVARRIAERIAFVEGGGLGGPARVDCVAGRRTLCESSLGECSIHNGIVSESEIRFFVNCNPNLGYVVQRGTPTSPGRVLGAALPFTYWSNGVEIDSPLRRELVNSVFGMGQPPEPSGSCSDVWHTSEPSNYCVGMARNQFVPLANELTSAGGSGEDSWKHYLRVAREAAEKADGLGQEWIESGLQREFRREGAQEELANLCGSFVDAQQVTASNGSLDTTGAEGGLNACLNQAVYDVVFLTEPTFTNSAGIEVADPLNDPDFKRKVWDAYCNDDEDILPAFCSLEVGQTESEAAAELELATLGLAPAVQPVTGGDCEKLIKAAEAGGTLNRNDVLDASRRTNAAGLQAALQTFRFVADTTGPGNPNEGRWRLLVDGTTVLEGNVAGNKSCSELDGDQELCETMMKVFGAGEGLHARVQRTLWYMGALAGDIAPGTFSMPVPVVDISETLEAQAPVVYGGGAVAWDAQHLAFRLSTLYDLNDLDDISLVGSLVPATSSVSYLYPQGSEGSWRDRLRTSMTQNGYYVAAASNSSIDFNEEFTDPHGTRATRDRSLGAWVSSVFEVGYDPGLVAIATDSLTALDSYTGFGGRDVCVTRAMPVMTWRESGVALHDFLRRCGSVVRPETAICDVVDDKTIEEWLGVGPPADSRHYYTAISSSETGMDPDCIRPLGDANLASHCLDSEVRQRDLISGSHDWYLIERQVAGERLRPTSCGPDERVEMFLHTDPGDFRATLSSVYALACLSSGSVGPSATPPPTIDRISDLKKLEGWLRYVEDVGVSALDGLALTSVPKPVVNDYRAGVIGTGTSGQGEHGQLLLQLRKDLEGMHQSWTGYLGSLAQIRSSVASARVRLTSVEGDTRLALLQLQRERLELDRQIAISSVDKMFGAAKITTSAVPKGAEEVISARTRIEGVLAGIEQVRKAVIQGKYARKMLEKVSLSTAIVEANGENAQQMVLVDLDADASSGYTGLDTSMSGFRMSVADAHTTLIELDQNASRATWQAAKAAGADFVEVNGEAVQLPVNTVLNRQYHLQARRYERALERAKRSAYLARLAIEQRLGVRLNELNTDVGPLPSPRTWVDDLCTMQGVDYAALKEAHSDSTEGGSADEEFDLIEGFADEYIGDYVDRLEEFVEFYNVEYPFKESDDTVVLSVRNDLIHSIGECAGESRNLLFFSHDLRATGQTDNSGVSLAGWRAAPCKDDVCVVAAPETSITIRSDTADVEDHAVEPPGGVGGVTWLKSVGVSALPVMPTETPDNPPDEVTVNAPVPPGALYQTVELSAGTDYVLSWWDLALSSSGTSLQADDTRGTIYEVVVYDAGWSPVALTSPDAEKGEFWSSRRVLSLTAPGDGDYHIAFFASPYGTTGGNVAIANVQLEAVADMIGAAGDYEPTDSDRWTVNADCRGSLEWNLRDAFQRVCEGGKDYGATVPTCWWELKTPIVLDVELAQAGYGPLVGKAALGNYNERHLSTALNVVGTGVIDCEKDASPDCYGRGYLEYDLVHTATNVPIVGYDANEVRCFDFASGAIRSGKALATERYMTMPLGAADLELLSQPSFTKTEFAGRPLSGMYRLRIKDMPGLAWDRVEDIQIVMNYRVWSRVSRPDGL